MEGLSERLYAARAGLSRGAIQKAKAAGRLVLYDDGSINAEASDARRTDRTEMTDPSKSRRASGSAAKLRLKLAAEAAVDVNAGDQW